MIEEIELTSCASKIAIFKGRCPRCGGLTVPGHYYCEVYGRKYFLYEGVDYCAYCPTCRILYVYNSRVAWEEQLSARCP